MELFNRSSLKNFFRNGSTPTESNFAGLIDSTVNKLDDGFSKTADEGIRLAPIGKASKLLSFFKHIQDQSPRWNFSIDPAETEKGLQIGEKNDRVVLFFKEDGGIGVCKTDPKYALDVEGTIASKSRVGTYKQSEVPADAEWHVLLDKVDDVAAFELVACVEGPQKRGKHAMAHASILIIHGRGKAHINQASYGWIWDRISIRVRTNDDESARIEMKTRSHYGKNDQGEVQLIRYHLTSLWDKKG